MLRKRRVALDQGALFGRCPLDRFWSKVDKSAGADACWPWTRCVSTWGYGQFSVRGRYVTTHRFAWELTNGPIPHGAGYHGTVVMHSCDNRRCCNPAHLSLGTQQDNIADRDAKGRQNRPVGSRNGRARFTEAQVVAIREECAAGALGDDLAVKYGLSGSAMSYLLSGKSWPHAGGPLRPAGAPCGEKSGPSKLTANQVRAIRVEYAVGNIGQARLGAKYGVTQAAVRMIVLRRTWAHVA